MAVVGYRRVSTVDQSLDRQDLGAVEKVFEEKLSGASASDRPALQEMLEWVREGDSVIVFSIDRLARNLQDLLSIVSQLNGKGVSIRFIKDNLTFPPEGLMEHQSSICRSLGLSLSLNDQSSSKGNARGSRRLKRKASTRAASPQSIRTASFPSATKDFRPTRLLKRWASVV